MNTVYNSKILHDPRKDADIGAYFRGEKLYGDDFSPEMIAMWYGDEKNAYLQLTKTTSKKYEYAYHALNIEHGYKVIPSIRYSRVLSYGGAFGDELSPIISQIDAVTIVDPGDDFVHEKIGSVPVSYVKPSISGILPFEDGLFNLITCFGALHHIPNVSVVLGELFRCLAPGGYGLVREPIVSMGDWRKKRDGLTLHERGIPENLFRSIIQKTGFEVIKEGRCVHTLTIKLQRFIKKSLFNLPVIVELDKFICNIPIWPKIYHAHNMIEKVRPASIFYVLYKPVL